MKNKTYSKRTALAIAIGIIALCIWAIVVPLIIANMTNDTQSDKQAKFTERPPFTIGEVDSLPRCVMFSTFDDEFKTIQADAEIFTSQKDNRIFEIKDMTTKPDVTVYIVPLDKIMIFQVTSAMSKAAMKNTYGPAEITCQQPDGKVLTGIADKIYMHENGACEFILGNTWYYTSSSRITIEHKAKSR